MIPAEDREVCGDIQNAFAVLTAFRTLNDELPAEGVPDELQPYFRAFSDCGPKTVVALCVISSHLLQMAATGLDIDPDELLEMFATTFAKSAA